MTVIPLGFAQINWQFTGDQLPLGAEVTMGCDVSSFSGSAQTAAAAASLAWRSNVMPVLNQGTVLVNTHVKFGPAATGEAGDDSTTLAGTGANPGMTPNVTLLVHKRTLFGGRAGRGRMFVPGLQESSVDEKGILDSGTVTAAQTAFDGLLSDLGTSLLIPVLLHGAASPITIPSTITDLVVDAKVATQRRRLRR